LLLVVGCTVQGICDGVLAIIVAICVHRVSSAVWKRGLAKSRLHCYCATYIAV